MISTQEIREHSPLSPFRTRRILTRPAVVCPACRSINVKREPTEVWAYYRCRDCGSSFGRHQVRLRDLLGRHQVRHEDLPESTPRLPERVCVFEHDGEPD
jgi:hypothetical protein